MADPGKTETATPRRREDVRKRGQVARSVEVNTAFAVFGILLLFYLLGSFMLQAIAQIGRQAWGDLGSLGGRLTIDEMGALAWVFGWRFLLLMGPFFLGVMLIGVLGNVLQFGFLVSGEPLTLKPENLNPARGFQRIFSRRSAIELVKNLIKILVVTVIFTVSIMDRFWDIASLMQCPAGEFFNRVVELSSMLLVRVGLAFVVIAILDYWYQRWEFEENIKMSKQEIKDEYRQLEGDPQIKARVRQLQREISRRRMLADLPKADVVITNPTHLAVAVKYDGKTMDAPIVLAKGARLMANRIKELARQNGIPVLENKPLARALYESTPVGGAVPGTLFSAVAELLAYVYQMQGTLASKAEENRNRIKRAKAGLGGAPA